MNSHQHLSRNIRVFISSTYHDMYAEREELAKRVFPQLRSLCERRGVTLMEIDLRWGIPESDVDAGKLLPICLAEVENCQPFFVCLLGARYGTMLTRIPEEIFEKEPWLREHPRKSITELEVLHGALNGRPIPAHAFFYLRIPVAAGSTSGSDFDLIDGESKAKLEDLKRRVLHSGHVVREYETPAQVGQLLLNDLAALFQELFPEIVPLDPLEQEEAAHDAFAASRCRIYVDRQEYFDRLDRYVTSQRAPLLITGASGSGKSSLLANWLQRRLSGDAPSSASLATHLRKSFYYFRRSSRPIAGEGPIIISHFVGASAESTDLTAMLRRLMEIMRIRFDLSLEIPLRSESLFSAFANYLQAVGERTKLILLLDGIDQFADEKQILGLAWLPIRVPPDVRIILAATRREMIDDFRKRGWPIMEIKPLRAATRKVVIQHYLAHSGKRLSAPLLKRVTLAASTANPLYLRTLLEELRLFGSHEALASHIQSLLMTRTTGELFGEILLRLEKDYVAPTPYRPELVRNTMRLIWAARHGLTESELTELLGSGEAPLPSAYWSPLYLAIKELLAHRSGLLSFSHAELRRAVEERYLPGSELKMAAHRELADYFVRGNSSDRRMIELPWHLAAISAWPELFSLLSQPEFLNAAWQTRRFDVKSFWSATEQHSPLRMVNAYSQVINHPTKHRSSVAAVCELLTDAHHTAEALKLSGFLEHEARESGDLVALEFSLSTQAELLRQRGDSNGALRCLQEQEQICRQSQNQRSLAASLGNQAVIMLELGQSGAALALLKQEETLCRQLQDLMGLSECFGNQGVVQHAQKNFREALALFHEQENICRQLGDLSHLRKSLGNQGLVHWELGDSRKALALLKRDEEYCRQLGEQGALNVCLGNQAKILSSLGDYDEAVNLYKQQEALCREVGDYAELALAFLRHSKLIAEKLNQPQFALPLAEEARRVAAQNGLKDLLADSERLIGLLLGSARAAGHDDDMGRSR